MTKTTTAKRSRPGRFNLVIPITERERIALKHKALDRRCSVGAMARRALGLPAELTV